MSERLEQIETNIDAIWAVIRENQQQISELRSSVSTLADLINIQQDEAQSDRAENNRGSEESRRQADQDRALMLQLIQNLAQGGNGGKGN